MLIRGIGDDEKFVRAVLLANLPVVFQTFVILQYQGFSRSIQFKMKGVKDSNNCQYQKYIKNVPGVIKNDRMI